MYSSLVSLSHLLSFSRLPNSRPATMVKPRFTIDVQTFTNLLLLVVPGGAVYFWTRGDQLDEEAMVAKMTKEYCTRYLGCVLSYIPYMVYTYVRRTMIRYDTVPERYTFRGCVLPPSTCLLS